LRASRSNRHQRDRDRSVTVEHPAAEPVKVGLGIIAPCDQLPVELHVRGEASGELEDATCHVPAAAATNPQPAAVGADECAEPVALELVTLALAGRERPRAGIGSGSGGIGAETNARPPPKVRRLLPAVALPGRERAPGRLGIVLEEVPTRPWGCKRS